MKADAKRNSSECLIVIPAHNEEEAIGEVLRELTHDYKVPTSKIVVVDSYSTDRTADIARAFGVRVIEQEGPPGKLHAILTALLKLRPKCVVIMDADGEHRAIDALRLLELVAEKGYDYAIGGRRNFRRNIIFVIGNKLLTKIFNVLFSTNFSDVLTGLIAFKPDVLRVYEIPFQERGFCLEIEALARALCFAKNIATTKIDVRNRLGGEKKLKVYVGLYILRCILGEYRRFGACARKRIKKKEVNIDHF